MSRIGFIGAGVVGTALAIRLRDKGYAVAAVADADPASAERLSELVDGCRVCAGNQAVVDAADLVFVTTPDDAIGPTAGGLAWRAGQSVVHCSGAASTDALEPAVRAGARVGGFHPLQSFADFPQAMENLSGSVFAIEAEGELAETLREMAKSLGGKWIALEPADKPVYHAAAVFACNYLVAVVKLATDLLQATGIPRREALEALLPMVRGTVNNLADAGLPEALTGPVARGDAGTLRKHLLALAQRAPELLPAYRELGRSCIPIAVEKGEINRTQAEEMSRLLS